MPRRRQAPTPQKECNLCLRKVVTMAKKSRMIDPSTSRRHPVYKMLKIYIRGQITVLELMDVFVHSTRICEAE